MSSKSKKKLTFLTTEKRNKLKQRIITEKQAYAQEFKEHFCNSYKHYLDHYPEKKSLFSIGMKMNFFVTLTELLLLHISGIFSDCQKNDGIDIFQYFRKINLNSTRSFTSMYIHAYEQTHIK